MSFPLMTCCSICLDPTAGQAVLTWPCGHDAHLACVAGIVNLDPMCPWCSSAWPHPGACVSEFEYQCEVAGKHFIPFAGLHLVIPQCCRHLAPPDRVAEPAGVHDLQFMEMSSRHMTYSPLSQQCPWDCLRCGYSMSLAHCARLWRDARVQGPWLSCHLHGPMRLLIDVRNWTRVWACLDYNCMIDTTLPIQLAEGCGRREFYEYPPVDLPLQGPEAVIEIDDSDDNESEDDDSVIEL